MDKEVQDPGRVRGKSSRRQEVKKRETKDLGER
jgi:hypothetical protein